jgi:hypothetical protein
MNRKARSSACGAMTDRTAEFEAAIRAQSGLISEAQEC